MRNTIIHSDVRQKILKSINVLIHHVREEEVNQALTCLQSLEHHFTNAERVMVIFPHYSRHKHV